MNTRWLLYRFKRDERGVAAIEFGLMVSILAFVALNVVDTVGYITDRMQVDTAATLGTMAVLNTCDASHIPASTNCSGVDAAVLKAVQSTSLGSKVTIVGGTLSEAYYCVNSSSMLVQVAKISSKPADCSAAGNANLSPADYVSVQVTYTYTPLFHALSVGSLLPSPITKTALMRIG